MVEADVRMPMTAEENVDIISSSTRGYTQDQMGISWIIMMKRWAE